MRSFNEDMLVSGLNETSVGQKKFGDSIALALFCRYNASSKYSVHNSRSV